ncbi:predicted protein [Nematostella vectensis]|uniref:Pleckstrin homology domain-containing family G member 7 n=1 Tax=Nematostella vectensis TaxID=45351 RepID=A7RG07_NEMVE|nr:uncharacterized protein LOC5522112 isoform X2 [Nematostella vectensis]EDO49694.1 predicted protein [Nematostella vectensis]|eukprot:XP_001641757.1 predicted protein [Nematostella vectensis]
MQSPTFGLAVIPRQTRTGNVIYLCGSVRPASQESSRFTGEDSESNPVKQDPEINEYSSILHVPDFTHSSRSNSVETDSSGYYHGNHKSRDSSRSHSPRITKSASTSMEDLVTRGPMMIDKATSTDQLCLGSVSQGTSREDELPEEFPESDSFRWRAASASSDNDFNNLTDAIKAKMLHRQLLELQTQSLSDRRKYSDVRRYWVDPTQAQAGDPVIHRTSSSPSILDGVRFPAASTGYETSNQSTSDPNPRSFQVPALWRRVSDENEAFRPTDDYNPRDSFHEDEFNMAPEASPTAEFDDINSRRSSGSDSPASQSPDEENSSDQSIIPSFSSESDPTQRSPRSSPPPFTIDVVIDTPNESSSESDSGNRNTQPTRRPLRRLGTTGYGPRPGVGHSVSLPAASFNHYLSVMRGTGSGRSDTEETIEEEEENEEGEPCFPVHRRGRRASLDDDEVYVKKNREKRKKKTSVSLRFEGDVARESAETLAADIAAFLQYRKANNAENEQSSAPGTETAAPPQEDDDISMAESAAIARARSLSRRRGSAVVSLSGERSYQMDLHVLNVHREHLQEKSALLDKKDLSGSSTSLNSIVDPEKRSRWSLLRRNKKMLYGKEKGRTVEDFREVLTGLRDTSRHLVIEHELDEYKDSHWTQFMSSPQGNRRPLSDGASGLSDQENKRREALWELFHSEVVYLMDHVLVLREVFLEPLRIVQQMEEYLQNVDPNMIFCNVEELCEVSAKFAKDLLLVFKGDQSNSQFGSTAAVVNAFTEFGWRVHPQYQEYCLNYSKVLGYLDQCKKSEDFQEFVKWCEADPRCKRLQLTDLLVAPLQHLTKYPLLLKNIRKRTSEGDDQHSSLSSVIKSVELSIKELEGKVKSLANLERLQELQKCLVWPSIVELDPKTYVPEFLRGILAKQPCEGLLTSANRQLLHEGHLVLHESTKQDVYAFLFDDMLLLTRYRKLQPKAVKKLSLAGMAGAVAGGTESPPPTPPITRKTYHNVQYTVYKQPIPLDRFIVFDAEATHAGNTLKNSFIIIHYSRFKQTIGLYTLQAPTQNLKETWTSRLKAAQSSWSEAVAMEIAQETEKIVAAHVQAQQHQSQLESPTDDAPLTTIPEQTSEEKPVNRIPTYHKPMMSQC